jgi:hypothetical protein
MLKRFAIITATKARPIKGIYIVTLHGPDIRIIKPDPFPLN